MFLVRKQRISELSAQEIRARQDASFFKKIRKCKNGCHLWKGAINRGGYGVFGYTGLGTTTTHRHAYRLANGPIPDGMHVLHRCDNPPCVNPDHLFLGTQQDNMADRKAKGRYKRIHEKGASEEAP